MSLTADRSGVAERIEGDAPGRGGDVVPARDAAGSLLPGLLLGGAIGAASWLLQTIEIRVVGRAVVDALAIGVLGGMAVRGVWTPPARFRPGLDVATKQGLELAFVLLGAGVSLALVRQAGAATLVGIVIAVAAAIGLGSLLGRALGLHPQHAYLVACGNAICGNAAISALAPVIGARREHVASSIAFTAVLGVLLIVVLPAIAPLLPLSHYQYGVLVGMVVYSVPQVLAAAYPVSRVSGDVAALVKLVRVLLLGPIVLFSAARARSARRAAAASAGDAVRTMASAIDAAASGEKGTPHPGQLVPWFVVAYLALAAGRHWGVVSDSAARGANVASHVLATLGMAALGLGVDPRSIRRAGRPVVLTVAGSLVVLLAVSVLLIEVVLPRR